MAVEISDGGATPHATDYADLLDLLVTFATANGWTVLQNDSEMTCLQGEGAGSDEIIVSIKKYAQGWNLNGYTGYTDGLTFYNQPGALPSGSTDPVAPSMPLWASSIPYWFIVNERRIIVVAKVSTTFQMCYLGWFLPYASPGQYPYPMLIGGSCGGQGGSRSGVATFNRAFWGPYQANDTTPVDISGVVYLPGGSKAALDQAFAPASNLTSDTFKGVFPYNTIGGISAFTDTGLHIADLASGLGSEKILTPLSLAIDETAHQGIIGDVDGLYFPCSGGAAEDIVDDGTDDYLLVPNVFRTAAREIVAVKLV